VIAGMLVAAPAADAVPLPPTPNPLPGGSTFEGADGDQTAAAPRTDWGTLAAAGRVEHSVDPNGQDTAFKGGTKENAPGEWDFVNDAGGVTPPEANILDVWTSIDEVAANTFLYLGFARAGGTGTTFLTFELNRDDRTWDNGRARVPCRRTGDVLITFQPQGNTVNLFVQTWKTSTSDPGTGCARTGSLSDAANVIANTDVQGGVNPAAIPNSLPGTFGATIPIHQFGETALNLGAVLARALGTSCGAFTSVWMHSRSSTSDSSNMQDYVAPHAIDLRRCSAAGTKWLDNNADGTRDPGDIGLAGFRIYADLNDNRRYDDGEPFAITDEHGDYVIDDIRASGTYTLREEPTSAVPLTGPWTCSHPAPSCTWTVDAAAEPYATERDFGNWRPARVTLLKQLDPPNDPGRFDLSVGTHTVPGAGDGDGDTFTVKPGVHTVAESPVAGTDAANYISSVACPIAQLARPLRSAISTTVTLLAGQHAKCTFVNVRRGSPSVNIQKVAPAFALRGATLHYTLTVTNTGTVPFPAADVRVDDPGCDAPRPALSRKLDEPGASDASPATLDPGDSWVYECKRATAQVDPDDCEPATATNTATVTVPGTSDSDSAATKLTCPPPRQPGVAIQKVGPATAVAGTPLTYVLYVTNIGEVPFPEADVTVSDPACDAAPELVARFDGSGNPDTTSPERLDPEDIWAYRCINRTPTPAPDCQASVVTNTSTVVATSRRPTVQDSDTVDTPLTCPPVPPEPPVPSPQPVPEPPVPVAAAGVVPEGEASLVPPGAGAAGLSRLSPLRGCLRRGSRVVVSGSRIANITLSVGGRRVGGLRVQALQRRAVIHVVGNPRPGRYRVTALIRFQRGSGTPAVTLTRTVRVCGARARAPRFTG
jgi:uncharacterized repeat protein (TIGR01451 family)